MVSRTPGQPPPAAGGPARPARGPAEAQSGERLPRAERAILTALAQHGPADKIKLAVLTGYANNGGGFNNAICAVRARGYVVGGTNGRYLELTPEGVAALGGDWQPLPVGRELAEYWLAQLPKAEAEILSVLIEAYPGEMGKETLAALTPSGYEPSGGGFNNALCRLRTLELITRGPAIRASEHLFG